MTGFSPLALLVVVGVPSVAAAVLWPTPRSRPPLLRRSRPTTMGGRSQSATTGGRSRPATTDGRRTARGLPSARGSGPEVARARWWRAAAHRRVNEAALAELLAALAAPLRAGVPPAGAIAAAGATVGDDSVLGPLVRDLTSATSAGLPVADVWRDHADSAASPDLAFVGRAWALSELTGAALADALATGEQVLLARARARERLAAAAAGPKASMAVLCLLPASGPVVGAVMGVGPRTLYFSSPVATGSLGLGIALGLAAWGWSRRILRSAS